MTAVVSAGVDSSAESRAAAGWAAWEAVLRDARLRLVHVEEWPLPLAVAVPTIDRADHRRWADDLLDGVGDAVRQEHPGLRVETRRLSGRPAAALAVEASEEEVELLVLGSRGLGTVSGVLMGSVGMAAVGAARTPVVLVREHGTVPGGDVVVGTDLGEPQDAVLGFAFAEAERRGCTLRAIHGWTLPVALKTEVARNVTEELHAELLPWRRAHPSVTVVERPVMGAADTVLIHEAAGAELVVVGRRERRSPLAPHIGHVAHAVIHHCSSPVAVIAHP
ncbi:universal stress protein [Streptomyces sp. ISL-10]|uniref:universal stress protein n=1 Tax=Streptomyces sp. ISL-10 TaxID=2819172 RepID=UPI001BE8BE93|nr:universal stress protein [Streptomyces sp. ISL-10]MBT2369405.1 universal stress protein [Streptomyces sp. ISL-10]